jgi:tetratricopeptide (TPR) repeat protein
MGKLSQALLMICFFVWALPSAAQTPCVGFSVVANTPEDQLMLAVNGADKPEEQVAALEKFGQEHADSKFMPCVYEYLTSTNVKLSNFDKAIEYGEKALAANYLDLNLAINLLKAYIGAGKANDGAFDLIAKGPDLIKKEMTPSKPGNISDADWQKMQEEATASAKDDRAFMEYAFFQLLPRVTDANKRVQYLDGFVKAYPDTTNAGQVNFQYFISYAMLNNMAKADEYGEKAAAADPPNIVALNLVADSYATRQINLDKAATYAKKALDLATSMKKPEGESDEQFKTEQNNALGLAHLTLGYVAFQRASKTKKVGPAIQDLNTAADLLKVNPEFQGKALYLLGNAYEFEYPPNHRLAIDALTKAGGLKSSFAAPSRDLLAKVKKAAGQ